MNEKSFESCNIIHVDCTDYDVCDISSLIAKLLPLTDTPRQINVKANGSVIYALQRDPLFTQKFARFRINVPNSNCLIIDTAVLDISTISGDDLSTINFSIEPEEITPETFRILVRRLTFGLESEKTKRALSAAFHTGRLNEEDIAKILFATWIDESRLSEIFDLIG